MKKKEVDFAGHCKASDINVRSVFAPTTVSHSGLTKLCGVMDLPKAVGSKLRQV